MSHYDEYDYVIINDDFSRALADLKHILNAEKLKLDYQRKQNQALIKELLEKPAAF